MILISLAAGVLVALGIYFFASKVTVEGMKARGWESLRTVTIPPGGAEQWTRFIEEKGSFRFGVLPQDGRVTMANGKVHDDDRKQVDPAAIEKLIKDGWWVEPDRPREWNGRLERGLHLWIVRNQSPDKPVTVLIDFHSATHP